MLVRDEVRTGAYRDALRKVVRPGDVVLDIGTGSGVLALLACQAGAGRVYAVESSPILSVARELAEANGLGDRVVFVSGDARRLELPERVDVIVAELISK